MVKNSLRTGHGNLKNPYWPKEQKWDLSVLLAMPDLNRNLQLMRRAHRLASGGDWKVLRLVSGGGGGRGGLARLKHRLTLN